ncbi:MAG: T9SS type A sorting domain-containing protein [Carboxylicivirga sp.]|jgi:hypothetical protein|nr:T9SS type A sorting domain-containing protein [Carboxylicivirga sp.]
MKKITFLLSFVLSTSMCIAQSFEFNTDEDNKGWDAVTNTSGTIANGAYTLQVTASQDFISLFNNTTVKTSPTAVNPSTVQYLHIVANIIPSTVKTLNLRFNNGANKTKEISNLLSPGKQTYTIDMNELFGTDWSSSTSINNFRIRFVNQTSAGDLTVGTDIASIEKIVFSGAIVLEISDLSSFGFSMYPNPVCDKVYFQADEPIKKIQIFNLSGKEIVSDIDFSNNCIDVSGLANGIYLAKVYINGSVGSFKFVKH